MKTLFRVCVLIAALVADGVVLWTAVSWESRPVAELILLGFGHIAAAALFAVIASHGRGKVRIQSAVLIAVAGGFVPVIGLIGATAVLRVSARPEAKQAATTCHLVELEPIESRLTSPRESGPSAARLRSILTARGEWRERIAALLAAEGLGPRNAIALYKVALRDPVDEVRLLAFSKLEGFRRRLERQIAEMSPKTSAAPRTAAAVHHRLAEAHDQLAYLGLVEGKMHQDALARAAEHARLASEVRTARQGSAYFTWGRALLRAGALGPAQRALDKARACGVSSNKIAPYSAEIAFRSRDFTRVRAYVRILGSMRRNRTLFRDVVSFWR